MKAKEINRNIKITGYLENKGIYPAKKYNGYFMYHSPFREDKTPSLKVSDSKNLWIDYSDNDGGTLIDLVLRLNPEMNVSEAIREIETTTNHSFSFQQQSLFKVPNFNQKGKRIIINQIKSIGSNPAISEYLQSRGISLGIAKKYCKELYYKIGDKKFFGLGNKTENGWAIRNKYWKGSSGQGISLYKNGSKNLAVFEGVFDLMSYAEMRQPRGAKKDYMVLNSLVNLKKAFLVIQSYRSVELFLDNDEQGKATARELVASAKNCKDRSAGYHGQKDLNDFWMSLKGESPIQERKSFIKTKYKNKDYDDHGRGI